MGNKSSNIEYTKKNIGWAYARCRWLDKEAAISANRERNEILNSLSNRVNYIFKGNKIYLGKLSPGCLLCGKGKWSCLFINGLCNANCFFCPQDRTIKRERPPMEENGIVFDSPQAYAAYLRQFNFRGMSFSGGETMLVLEKVLLYIRLIRKEFGKHLYIWLYTNGRLIDKNVLVELKKAGLDEIRFDIKADGYNLGKVSLARGYIGKVTVEIPAIPEDSELLKNRLRDMIRIGVDYLNIHQLYAAQNNYNNFIKRNYTFLHHPYVPVLDSELAALKLIRYILDKHIKLSVQYCSQAYKTAFQKSAARKRAASFVKKDYEGLANTGYIRSLSIKDEPLKIKKYALNFQKRKIRKSLWEIDCTGKELFFHHTLLKHINPDAGNLILRYILPQLSNAAYPGLDCHRIELSCGGKISAVRIPEFYQEWQNLGIRDIFKKLFVEGMRWQDIFKHFAKYYKLEIKADAGMMVRDLQSLKEMMDWEEIASGFPELY